MKQTYTGTCHCGDVVFSFESEPITGGVRCNCSMCKRLGIVHSFRIPPGELKVLAGEDKLKIYLHGDKVVPFTFCANCGVYVFYRADVWSRVNLGCVDSVDTFAIDIEVRDGKSV